MRRLWIVPLVALVASGAWADLARSDPPDPRLQKTVTLDADHVKLEDVAKSLSEQSGVEIKAGTGKRDWKVRESHLTIHAKDVPLVKLLDQTSKLLGYLVSREGRQGEWTYTIWQDKKARDLESEMITAETEAGARRAKQVRQSALDTADKASKMTPDEARKLRDKDPFTAYLGGTRSGRGFAQLLSSLGDTERDLMLRGKRVTIPFSSLSPEMQQAALDSTHGGIAALVNRTGPDTRGTAPYQLVISPLNNSVAPEMNMMGIGGAVALMGMVPGTEGNPGYDPILGPGEIMSLFLLARPDSTFSKLCAKGMWALEDGTPAEQVDQMLESGLRDATDIAAMTVRESPTEQSPPTDPQLTREVDLGKLPAASGNLRSADTPESNGRTVAEISKATHFASALESFPGEEQLALYLKPGKQPLYKILIGLEKAGYTWKLEDSTLRIRPENWALMRSYAIPEATLVRYEDLLDKQGMFTLDDLAMIASELTDEQLDNNLMHDRELGFALWSLGAEMGTKRKILRLYHSLSTDQRDQLTGEKGLQFADLSSSQWDYLGDVIAERLGGIYVVGGSLRLVPIKGSDRTQDESRMFTVIAATDDQKDHKFDETIVIRSKNDLAPLIRDRATAKERAAQASEQTSPAQTPIPAK